MSQPAFTLKDLGVIGLDKQSSTLVWRANRLITLKSKQPSAKEVLSSFQAAVNRASIRIATDLKIALDDALRSGVWDTLTGSADIYDTGELLASGTVSVTGNGVSISYDAPYAALVHYGGYVSPYGNQSARVYLPPRPWIESILNGGGPVAQFDFASYYMEEIKAEFS